VALVLLVPGQQGQEGASNSAEMLAQVKDRKETDGLSQTDQHTKTKALMERMVNNLKSQNKKTSSAATAIAYDDGIEEVATPVKVSCKTELRRGQFICNDPVRD